jgi:hypothetical protein
MDQARGRTPPENGSVTFFMLRGRGRESRLQSLVDVGSTMSEPEKKGSAWPWILVPVAAISLFFVLRECRQNLPPAPDHAAATTLPATPDSPAPADPKPADPEAMPVPEPAPQ